MFNIKEMLVELVAITSLIGLCLSSHLTVKEGEALSLRIKNPPLANITTFTSLTIDEYNDLLADGISSSHSNCSEEISAFDGVDYSEHVMLSILSEFELSSLSYLDPAEDDDLGQKEYNFKIPPDCKANCTVQMHVEDDDMFENEEYFIMLINGRRECAVIVEIMDDDSVGFSWSEQQPMYVFENQGNITALSIVKTGNNEHNMTVRVEVMVTNTSNEASQGIQFDLLQSLFVFDNETFNLSVPFVVYDGTVALCPKQFYLSFHVDVENDTSLDHSNSVRIFIINSVNYINQPKNVTVKLGESISIPCEREWDQGSSRSLPEWYIKLRSGSVYHIKDEHSVPVNHARRGDELTVVIEDIGFNLSEYSCSYTINYPIPETNQTTGHEINSTIGVLTIAFPNTTFSLRQNDSATRVGGLFYFQIVKQGGGDFAFNVSLNYTGPAAIYQTSVILNEVTNKTTINASIPDHLVLDTNETVSITILQPIQVEHYLSDSSTQLNTSVGDPLIFTVYANEYTVGLSTVQGRQDVSTESGFKTFRALLHKPTIPDLDPATRVKLDIGLTQDNQSWFQLSVGSVTLTHSDREVRFNVTFLQEVKLLDCQDVTNFTVFLEQSVDPTAEYTVTFRNQSVTVTVLQESCPTPIRIISIIVIPIIIGLGIILCVIVLVCRKRKHSSLTMHKTGIN